MSAGLALVALVLGAGLGLLGALVVLRRPPVADGAGPAPELASAVTASVAAAVAAVQEQAVAERDAAVQAALQQAAVLQRQQLEQFTSHHRELMDQAGVRQQEQLGAHLAAGQQELAAKKDAIDARLDQVQRELRVADGAARRAGRPARPAQRRAVRRGGRVAARPTPRPPQALVGQHAEPAGGAGQPEGPRAVGRAHGRGRAAAGRLHRARQLREADRGRRAPAPCPTTRSRCRRATSCTWTSSSRWPPTCATSRPARTPSARPTARPSCATSGSGCGSWPRRDYAHRATGPSVDYVLLFLPNETLTGFIHEHDPDLVDDALGQKVVLCSPLTLFALLGVIRQAFDNFMVEQTSDEILSLLGALRAAVGASTRSRCRAWSAKFDAVHKELEQLVAPGVASSRSRSRS